MTLETKTQLEALKRLEKGLPVNYAHDRNFTYLTTDGYYAVKIPDDSFFLDVSKIRESKSLASKFDISCRYALSETKDMHIYKKGVAKRFDSGKGNVYADEKLLKKLTLNGTKLFTDENMEFIYLTKNNIIYAVMISVKINEKEENC